MHSFSSDSWSEKYGGSPDNSQEITNAELGLAEDHFSQPEVGNALEYLRGPLLHVLSYKEN